MTDEHSVRLKIGASIVSGDSGKYFYFIEFFFGVGGLKFRATGGTAHPIQTLPT